MIGPLLAVTRLAGACTGSFGASTTGTESCAKDVEHFDDILRNSINETNKYEGSFGKIPDEEKIWAVKKLMPESLLNCRFPGTTLPYEELPIALENIIMDKVTTHSASKVKKIDMSAPMQIGMAAGTDSEEAFEEEYGKTSGLALQAVYKGTGARGGWNGGHCPSWSVQKYFNSGKGEKGANRAGKGKRSKTGGKKGKREVAKVTSEFAGVVGSWNKSLNAVEEDKGDISEEVHEDKNELRAWCLLEESENEQWQVVTSKKSKLKLKKLDHVSLLSVEASPRKVIEVKDNWVNIRATMDTGAAGHVVPADMFPRVKLDRTSTTEIRCSKWRKDQRFR